ncbi:endonuclease-8 [Friedmanniella luteola]|uniref:DNA-(apurinic or apyrimidinic site) lyase n=1 Tax=Friedmanniella luteola TaxID=546871 RepID=A0A1H1Y226_9ACTN|nr:DNA-formamidopyrimidine glycosylase family protein [Friedmanniella luteola]SDT15483.1 endonuclease-8 [Friedmanniella luteola]
MPEGDSVYQVARKLEPALVGQPLVRGELRVPAHATDDLAGHTVTGIDTHGKHLLTRLDSGLTLHTHLMMDGSWTVTRPGRRLPRDLLPDVRVLLETRAGSTAYGISMPVVELVRTTDEHGVVGHLGPDPLRADWDPAEAAARLAADPARPLAAALLDQRNVAGLGNLWVNELCFLRGHSPWTPVGEVDLPALLRLAARALKHSALVPGAYQVTTGHSRRGEDHWVAGRSGQPCRRCRTPVEVAAEVTGDPERRRTWWCPRCQPGPGPDR